MTYDPWDIEARFFFDRSDSEEEALGVVRSLLDEQGDAYADDLELVIGGGPENLTGAALVQPARRVVSGDREVSESADQAAGESAENGDAVGAKAVARTRR